MRATNLPHPAPLAAFRRRCFVALAVIAASTTTMAVAGPFARPSLVPQFGPLLLGQGGVNPPRGAGIRPGMGGPLGAGRPTMGGMRPGFGNQKNAKGTNAKGKTTAPEVDPALLRDKTALPPGYRVPPEPLPDIKIVKELPVPTKVDSKDPAYKEWKAHVEMMKKYTALLRQGNFMEAGEERKILRYGIKYKLALMTQRKILFPTDDDREKIKKAQEEEKRVEAPPTIENVRDDLLLKDFKYTNAFNGGMEIRDAFIDILCEEIPKLYDNNYYARFNAILILCNINRREEDRVKMTPEEPEFKTIKPLLELVNSPKQDPTYKIHPIIALARMCRHKNCKPEDRFAIMESFISQLALAKTLPEWYGWRLAEQMAQLGDPNDRTRQPVIVDALVKVLKDPGYAYRIRSEAARSLGRIPLDQYRKADEIAVEMLRLGEQMAVDFEKTQKDPRWKLYFYKVYLGFQPEDATERTEKKGLLAQVDSKPALAATKTVVTEAYQNFLPLAQNVLGGRASAPIPDQLRKIKIWLDARGKPALAEKTK